MNNIVFKSKKSLSSSLIMFLVIILLCIFLSFRSPFFFKINNFLNILEASSYKLILATAMTFVISMGGIDLSLGSVLSLSGIILAMCLTNGVGVFISIIICICAGILMGGCNGIIIEKTNLNPLIITLATSWIYRGISLIITKGIPITKLGNEFLAVGNGDVFLTKTGVIFALIFVVICFPLLNKCKWGHYIKSIGSNELSLKRTGVNVGIYKIGTYIFMGACASLASIIITAKLNSAEPNAGLGMEFDIITAVIMGGTPLTGGKASLLGTTLAVFLLSIIRNGLTILSVSPFYQQLITGLILLIAVIITEVKKR